MRETSEGSHSSLFVLDYFGFAKVGENPARTHHRIYKGFVNNKLRRTHKKIITKFFNPNLEVLRRQLWGNR